MRKFFVSGVKSLVVFGVIATAGVPAAIPPSLCHEETVTQKPVTCIYMPIILIQPEDGAPPPTGRAEGR